MDAHRDSLSLAQVVAYELASHELGRRLDDVAGMIWSFFGGESVLGRLADEARWAAFLLHDRIASHAIQNGGMRAELLTSRAPAPCAAVRRPANRLGPELSQPRRLDLALRRRLAAALLTTRAALAGMTGGYGRAYPSAHAIMEVLRNTEDAVDALQAEFAPDEASDQRGGVRLERPSVPSRRASGAGRTLRALLLRRVRGCAPRRSRAPTMRRPTPAGT